MKKKSYDVKKEWPKIKKQLMDMSQQTMALVKKGEKELMRLSEQGKLHLDSTALGLKKEKLFYDIGKEYVQAKCPAGKTPKIQKLFNELQAVNKQMRALKKKLKGKKAAKVSS